jgi:hypothetical protein
MRSSESAGGYIRDEGLLEKDNTMTLKWLQ